MNIDILKYVMKLSVDIVQANKKKSDKIKPKDIGKVYRKLIKEFNITITTEDEIYDDHFDDCECPICEEERQQIDQGLLTYDISDDLTEDEDEDDEEDEDED